MIKQVTLILFVIGALLFTACNTSVDVNTYIDKAVAFNLTINKVDAVTRLVHPTKDSISVGSDKHIKLIHWLDINKQGWQVAHASFMANVLITQRTFKLLYNKGSDYVVIGFVDDKKASKQYSKKVKKGELDFLAVNEL